jgi:uncharacterized membrane protein
MHEKVIEGLIVTAKVLEIVGASALVLGFIIASVRCFRQSLSVGAAAAVTIYRRALGRAIVIGLEVLVAATIIKTITLQHTLEDIGFLAIIVAVRTVLGWTMAFEMDGRWPWQIPKPTPQSKQG